MEVKEGTVFFRVREKDFIQVIRIETHYRSGDGKRQKHTEPIYHIEYLLNFKPPIRNYMKDIKQMCSYGFWIKQTKDEQKL